MAEIVDLGSASESESEAAYSDVSSSCDVDPWEVRANLVDLLDNVKSPGTFACSMNLKTDFVDPKITVGGVGPVQLPLTPDAARAIAQACHQAPFGRGEETVVDPSVRNTWELNPGNFSITEPNWNDKFLPKVLRDVGNELGVFSNCRSFHCELYKMLLYEQGAMFKPHRDSEKTPGMFGTLVICLPSPHEGGDVHTSHAKHSKVLKSSDCTSSIMAWYSDVEHEVKEVTAGYRWVLTYNLIADGPIGSVSAAANSADRIELRRNLKAWKTELTFDPSYRNRLVHLLSHRYTDASLQLSSLKGGDRKVANLLKESCDSVGFKLFLASFERMRFGQAEPNSSDDDDDEYRYPYDEDWDEEEDEPPARERSQHFIEEELESSLKLTRVIELSGTEVAQDIDIKSEDVIQEDALDDYVLDHEDYEGYTGNAGCTATHWYRMTALVIVPQEHVARFLLSQFDFSYSSRFSLLDQEEKQPREQRLRNLIRHLKTQHRMNASEENCRATLVDVCRYALDLQRKKPDAKNGSGPFSLEQALPRAYNIFSWDKYLDYLMSWPSTHEDDEDDEDVEDDDEDDDEYDEDPDTKPWADEKMGEVLQKTSKIWLEDSPILAEILRWETNGGGKHARALQLLLEHSKNTPAMVHFLTSFREQYLDKPEEMDIGIFKPVLNSMLHWFTLSMDPRTVRLDAAYDKGGQRLPLMEGRTLASLLLCLRDAGFDVELNELARKIKAEASRMNVLDLNLMVSPFLERLAAGSPWHAPADVMSQPFRSLFETLLEQCALRYVGKEPKGPDWSTPELKCRCLDCREMNEFLRDPNQRVIRWKATKKERRHLHEELNDTSCEHRTDHARDPNTMVVKKTIDKSKENKKSWDRRMDEFAMHLGTVNMHVNLRQIFGEDLQILRSAVGTADTGPSGTGPPVVPLTDTSLALASKRMDKPAGRMQGTARWVEDTAQPLASTSGNSQRLPATPGPSNMRGSASTPMKNTPESREAVKRKASEIESVDLTPLRNTEEMRREVRQRTTDVEVLDLTAD
ncbi:hypothetical protein SLS55_006601 [Diplodia seriata]|uniref:Prolyl 4-hydroxylase alpha subunit Fe(2+) 2OG dioxygenase domain-containing protein n=1 Tax=Diplodia seriata TaxID=420778 RepID=A0ABR3CFR9_9PEZI